MQIISVVSLTSDVILQIAGRHGRLKVVHGGSLNFEAVDFVVVGKKDMN